MPCEKCHADIADEMASHTGPHTELSGSWSGGSFSRLYCEDCHRVFYSYKDTQQTPAWPKYTYALGLKEGSTPGKEAHAASTVECMDCHCVVGNLHGPWNADSYHAIEGKMIMLISRLVVGVMSRRMVGGIILILAPRSLQADSVL